jgi:hypothetical protein
LNAVNEGTAEERRRRRQPLRAFAPLREKQLSYSPPVVV